MDTAQIAPQEVIAPQTSLDILAYLGKLAPPGLLLAVLRLLLRSQDVLAMISGCAWPDDRLGSEKPVGLPAVPDPSVQAKRVDSLLDSAARRMTGSLWLVVHKVGRQCLVVAQFGFHEQRSRAAAPLLNDPALLGSCWSPLPGASPSVDA